MSVNSNLREVALTVPQTVDILKAMVDPDRVGHQLDSARRGMLDGLDGKNSLARPGDSPDEYGSGYHFGLELRDLLFWTHEVQADGEGAR